MRIGLGGSLTAGLAVTALAATTALAVLVAVRALGAEESARRAAPFLVLTPAAVFMAVSADALFPLSGRGAWRASRSVRQMPDIADDLTAAEAEQTPAVVFACRANGGRSVAARLLTEYYAQGRIKALSAGTEPGEHIHPESTGCSRHSAWTRLESNRSC